MNLLPLVFIGLLPQQLLLSPSSVINYGYTQSKRLVFGFYAKFAAVIILCGFGTHLLNWIFGGYFKNLKKISVLQLFCLASKMLNLIHKTFSSFFLQSINTKIIFAGDTFPSLPYYQRFFYKCFVLLLT